MGMMGIKLNPCKANTEGVLGLCLCPNCWHPEAAADSIPYFWLHLQPDAELFLQHKHRLSLAAVQHWCFNSLAPPKLIQDMILAVFGRVLQYVAPSIPDDSNTAP